MTQNYPENSIQFICDKWWIKDNSSEIQRGCLIKTFLPHIDQITNQFVLKGRTNPIDHYHADFEIKKFNIKSRRDKSTLPVAAMPIYPGEIYTIHRSKSRYALVLSCGGDLVDNELRKKTLKWQTAHKLIVAPYYGVNKSDKRVGFPSIFVDRIKEAEYSQFFWDKLPTSPVNNESILKLNHIQPVGEHHQTYEKTNFKLSDDALEIIDSWIDWLLYGAVIEDSILYDFKVEFQ